MDTHCRFRLIRRWLSAAALALMCSAHAGALPVVSVDTYGAVGDGKTDATRSIQRAFAKVKSTGGTLTFKAGGVYLVSDTVGSTSLTDRLRTVTVEGNGATLLSTMGRVAKPVLRMMGTRLTVRNLTISYTHAFTLQDANIVGGDALYIGGTQDYPGSTVLVENNRFNGSWFAAIHAIFASYVTIRGNTCTGCLATSIFGGDLISVIDILNNTVTLSRDDGIFVGCGPFTTAATDVVISGNTVTNGSANGIGVGGVWGATILNNTITGTYASGIRCEQEGHTPDLSGSIAITGNVVRNPGCYFGPGRYHPTIAPMAAGILVAGNDPAMFTGVNVESNQVSDSAHYGIVTSVGTEVEILTNTVSGCALTGILVGNDAVAGASVKGFILAGNTLQNLAHTGITMIDVSHGKVVGNTVASFGVPGSTLDRGLFVYSSDTIYSVNNTVINDRGVRDAVLVATSTSCPVITGAPSATFGSAAPTTGTWQLGAIVLNSSMATRTTLGWSCTTASPSARWKAIALTGW